MFSAVLMVNVPAASNRQNKPQNYWNISTCFFDYYVVNVQVSLTGPKVHRTSEAALPLLGSVPP